MDKKEFYIPNIDIYKYKKYSLCLKYCLGKEYTNDIDSKEEYLYRYSNNNKLRKNCCFGDLVNSIFLYMIKRRIVDYDLVTKNREDLKEPEVIMINDPNEIKKALPQNIALYHWGRY